MRLQIVDKQIDVPDNTTITELYETCRRNLNCYEWNEQSLSKRLNSYRLVIDENTRFRPFRDLVPVISPCFSYNHVYTIYDLTTRQQLDINKCFDDYIGINLVMAFDYSGNGKRTLYDLGFRDGDLINYDNRIEVFLKTINNKTLTIKISANSTISQLMEKIQVQESIPFEQQLVILAGKTLDLDKSIAYYKIQFHTVLHLILKS